MQSIMLYSFAKKAFLWCMVFTRVVNPPRPGPKIYNPGHNFHEGSSKAIFNIVLYPFKFQTQKFLVGILTPILKV